MSTGEVSARLDRGIHCRRLLAVPLARFRGRPSACLRLEPEAVLHGWTHAGLVATAAASDAMPAPLQGGCTNGPVRDAPAQDLLLHAALIQEEKSAPGLKPDALFGSRQARLASALELQRQRELPGARRLLTGDLAK